MSLAAINYERGKENRKWITLNL